MNIRKLYNKNKELIIIASIIIIIILFKNLGLLSFLDYSPEYDMNYDEFTSNDLVKVGTGVAVTTCGATCKTISTCSGGSYCIDLGGYGYLSGTKWISSTSTRTCYNGAAQGTELPIVSVSGGAMTLTAQYKTTAPLRARKNFYNTDLIMSLKTNIAGGTNIAGAITSNSVIYEVIWNPENINQYAVFENGKLVKNATVTNGEFYIELYPITPSTCDSPTSPSITIEYLRYRSSQPGPGSISGVRTRTFTMPDYRISPGSTRNYEIIIDVERIKSGTTSNFNFNMTANSTAGRITKVYEFTVTKQ